MTTYEIGDRVRVRDTPAMRQLGAAHRFGTVARVGRAALGIDVDGLAETRTLFYDEVQKVGSVPAPREVTP